MHMIQARLLELSNKENLAGLSLREMGRQIGLPNESPQKIKHHLLQLQKKGFLTINRAKGMMDRSSSEPDWAKGLLKKARRLFSIPIIGTASCGPLTIFAEENFQGFLRVSSKLVGLSKPDGLFAIRADGSSMNRAEIDGKQIEDGDFVIVKKDESLPENNEMVLVIVDDRATIKRFIKDEKNAQIILKADSSYDYEPIHLHPDDKFFVNGKVVGVIKRLSE